MQLYALQDISQQLALLQHHDGYPGVAANHILRGSITKAAVSNSSALGPERRGVKVSTDI